MGTGNTSHMPQLTLQCAVTYCPVGLPFSWQLAWQDPLSLRIHHKDVSRQVFVEPFTATSFSIAGFVWGFFNASCRTNRNPSNFYNFYFIYPLRIYSETKTSSTLKTLFKQQHFLLLLSDKVGHMPIAAYGSPSYFPPRAMLSSPL